jgi:asparagine synthetase B (glutamine-hydrolysing)
MNQKAELLLKNEKTGEWRKAMVCLIPKKEIKKLAPGSILDFEDEQTITQYEVLEVQTSPLKIKTKIIAQKIKVTKAP